jgi:hypothetical protein
MYIGFAARGIAKAAASAAREAGRRHDQADLHRLRRVRGVIKLLAHIAGKRTVAIGTAPFSIARGGLNMRRLATQAGVRRRFAPH